MRLVARFAIVFSAALTFALGVSYTRADEGMWLLNRPPLKILKEKYNFEPDAKWFEHLQKSSVRFSTGGSGEIVSADGLVMTNHHVGEDMLEKLSTPDNDLHTNGYYAATRDKELKCPDLELNVLWEIEDVTQRVNDAAKGKESAEANTARREAINTIEKESLDKTGLKSEVVTLWKGARYHLYRYKRYTDVRLVFAPETAIAFFGGDTDNFEYPRFDLDITFFRIYENDKPLKPDHFLKWSKDGVKDGEVVFVTGHPANTRRLNTVDSLKYARDVELPATLHRLWRREVQLQTFMGRSAENERIGQGEYLGVQNSRKAFTGMLAGLYNPDIMGAKMDAEKKLRDAVAKDPQRAKEWGKAWDDISAAMTEQREFALRYIAVSRFNSDLFRVALNLVRMAEELPKPNAQRLPEYSDAARKSLELELYSPAPIYEALEIDRIDSRLSNLAEMLGAEDALVKQLLDGKSPRGRAEEVVRGTKLKDVAVRKQLAEGGMTAISASTDPMIKLARAIDPEARTLRKRYEDRVQAVERESYAKIAAAQFATYGEDLYPDATFTLRLAFGVVKGYDEAGRKIPPWTTLGGMYERAKDKGNKDPFEAPKRWAERKDKLKLDTPFDFISTADIIGGNSGSPTVNKAGELVGIIFDGNIYSLILDIAYEDVMQRALSVDCRGIIEALRNVYDAKDLVNELLPNSK